MKKLWRGRHSRRQHREKQWMVADSRIKQFLLCAVIGVIPVLAAIQTNAQTQNCPADKVCITREAALKALADSDTVKAQTTEIAAKDKAISDLKDELAKMRIEFTAASSEASILKQQQVRTDAIIELLLKMVRPKKFGIINF